MRETRQWQIRATAKWKTKDKMPAEMPERLHVSPEHPWFDPVWSRKVMVRLDGELVRGCIWADRVAGSLEHYVVAPGRVPQTEVRRGVVTFEAPPDAPARPPKIPTFDEVVARRIAGKDLSALDSFVYWYAPTGEPLAHWRKRLATVLAEAVATGPANRQDAPPVPSAMHLAPVKI